MGAPHGSAPPATHLSAPLRMPSTPAAGTHSPALVHPTVHLAAPAEASRPIFGNHVTIALPQPMVTVQPHVVIGFPPPEAGGRFLSPSVAGSILGPRAARNSGALSFSGEGHDIWQNSTAASAPQSDLHRRNPISPGFPTRPVYPIGGGPIWVWPVYGPGSGFGGWGWGMGFGFNSWGCGPYVGWGVGCDAFPNYDFGNGNYGDAYGPGVLEGQIESQNGPAIYEGNPEAAPMYGGGERQLVQLYLKDGAVYDVTDYWLVNDNDLHFMTVDATGNQMEHVIGFGQLDLQKTIHVNMDRGYRFVLRNEPLQGTEGNVPEGMSAPGPMQPPAPPNSPAVPQTR